MSLYGSCCEEQEAQEAAVRARVRAVTQHTEKRLMRGQLEREKMQRALRCPDPCCTHLSCGECEEDEEDLTAEPTPAATKKAIDSDEDGSDDFDEFDDDAEEEAFMARIRAARLEQMQSGAQAGAKRLACRGMHARLRDGQSLAALLADPEDDSPVIAHVAAGDDASEHCLWVEDALRRAARELPFARLVTDTSCHGSQPPECLPFLRALPALIVVERGVISAVCEELGAAREPEAVRALVSRWLNAERLRLVAAMASVDDDDDDDDDDEAPSSYCGRAGCRAYPHQHVGSKEAGGDGMPNM